MFINGEWIDSKNELNVYNPVNGELVGSVPVVGETETIQAIDAADKAFSLWSNLGADTRADYLYRIVEKVD
ncbi:aldehyde dehydrogenase family protein [Peribacillus frigoritolerans]|nr:aldehyde dehydrogenase family protein [Peribacillus frigoritolerans]